MGDVTDAGQQEPLGLLQLPAVVLCQVLATIDQVDRRALFCTCHAGRRIVLATCGSVRLHPRKESQQRLLAQLLELGPGQTCLELRLSFESIRWGENFLPKIGMIPMLRQQQLQALSLRNGTTVIGACAVSLAMALRSLRRLEVAEMWFQGEHFFKTLCSAATQLTRLKLDSVMLLDPKADQALSLVGTELPLLQELELRGLDADACAAHPALLRRVTHLTTSAGLGAHSWLEVLLHHTHLLTNLRTLTLGDMVCLPCEALVDLRACPNIQSVEAYALTAPGIRYHSVNDLSDEEEEEEDLGVLGMGGASGTLGHQGGVEDGSRPPVDISDGPPPSLKVLTLEHLMTAALVQFPALAKVPELRLSFLDLPHWGERPQEEALAELRSAAAVLAAVPRLTGHAPDSRAARRRGPVLQGLPKDGQSHLLPQVLGCLAPMAHHLSAMGLHGITLDPRAIPAALKDMVGEVCESLCLSQCFIEAPQATWRALLAALPRLTTLQLIHKRWPLAEEQVLEALVSAVDGAQRPLTLQLAGGLLDSKVWGSWCRKIRCQSTWVTVTRRGCD